MDTGAYFDETAPFYDAHFPQLGDEQFYRDLAAEADGPVLEVGCGTGRIYLELLADGVDADGIDLSAGMLAELERKAADRGLEPRVRQADVRTFEPDREYALAIVPFRAFLHLTSVEDRLRALERLHDALGPDGRLALNAFVPNFQVICEHYGQWEETDVEVDGESFTYRTRTDVVDDVEQVVRIRTEVRDETGELVTETEAPLALVSRPQFELLFRCSPFTAWSVTGGFEGEPLESAAQEQVWIVEV